IPLQPAISKVPFGKARRFTMVVRDLTERKRAEEELRRAHAELDQRVRQRTAELREANGQLMETNKVLVTETNERRRAEEALRVSEERYRTLVRLAPDALLLHRDDEIHFVNPAALRLFGAATAEQVEGLTLSDLVVPDSQARMRDYLRGVLESRRPAP